MPVEGFCTYERRDEFGALPPEIAVDLSACSQRGARSALRATLERANVLVIAVPDAKRPNANTGIEALRRTARARAVPHWIVDSDADLDGLSVRLRELERAAAPLRIMVTGPRATRWRDGERVGWRLIAQLALTPVVVAPRKHRVLVIDDHRDTAETACALLRALGHDAVAAMSGTRGLELAAELDPDVGLFDIGLPDLSGYEVARRLRASQAHPLFLAAITGWDQARDASRAFEAGFDRHVVKPASAEMIRELIDEASMRLPVAAAAG